MQQELETLQVLIDKVIEFTVAYGFQILGAIVVLIIGLKVASWCAARTVAFGSKRGFDPTLTRFIGNVVRILLLAVVIIITLNNFGITIAPFVALAGAAAFGCTMALQGPLSNYGAGLSIILTRPFTVGNTIQVQKTFGVVEEITLAATVLTGEDGETITIPNKEIVGQVIVNSKGQRVVETKLFIGHDQDSGRAVEAIKAAIAKHASDAEAPPPQVGLHDFAHGGVVVGARFWVPSLKYFQMRYAINRDILDALAAAGIELKGNTAAVLAPPLTADEPLH